MIVVDTSAVITALVGRPPNHALSSRLSDDTDLHAPHLIDIELIHALRRLVLNGNLSEDRASDVRVDFADISIMRYPHLPLADRIWALRHTITAYDAAFVALGEVLDVPVITCDARLASAIGHSADIELFEER